MSVGDALPAGSGHLGGHVSAYVDRCLPAHEQLAFDRHVVVCIACRTVADDERRLLASLRAAPIPRPNSSLAAALRDMASFDPSATYPVPTATRPQLVVLRRTAPPMHRSPVRAALVAGLAAGASAAAAWSLGVVGVSAGAGATQLVVPSAAPPTSTSSGSTSSGSATGGSSAAGSSSAGVAGGLVVSQVLNVARPTAMTVGMLGPRARVTGGAPVQAQSTP